MIFLAGDLAQVIRMNGTPEFFQVSLQQPLRLMNLQRIEAHGFRINTRSEKHRLLVTKLPDPMVKSFGSHKGYLVGCMTEAEDGNTRKVFYTCFGMTEG
ncbi:hypothetical protein K1719_017342 [Acacia pycnantha]|nr:hypothetical protein K1719_017342 [Acacia pycnantha]